LCVGGCYWLSAYIGALSGEKLHVGIDYMLSSRSYVVDLYVELSMNLSVGD